MRVCVTKKHSALGLRGLFRVRTGGDIKGLLRGGVSSHQLSSHRLRSGRGYQPAVPLHHSRGWERRWGENNVPAPVPSPSTHAREISN